MITTYNVLNTIAAAGADASLAAQALSITGAPVIRYGTVAATSGLVRSLAATRNRYSVAFTAANNTDYSFRIIQTVNGVQKSSLIFYTSDSTGTAAEIIAAISAQLTALNFDVTVSGSSSPIIIKSTSTNPLFTIVGVSNITPTVAMDACTGAAGSGTGDYLTAAVTSIAGTTTVTVSSVAHGLSVGMNVTIALGNYTGGGTLNSSTSGGTFRVATVPTADTFTLSDCTKSGTITVGTTTTVTLVAQAARGTVASLTALGVDSTLLTSGNTYTSLDFTFNAAAAAALNANSQSNARFHTIYFNDTDSDFETLYTKINEFLDGYIASSTTANPEAFSLK